MGSEVSYFDDRATVNFASPPTFGLISRAANLAGFGGSGEGFFWNYEFNDPAWNGTFLALANVTVNWWVENIFFSADADQTPNLHSATIFGSRWYNANAQGPYTGLPSEGAIGNALSHFIGLWNNTTGEPEAVMQLTGFGAVDYRFFANQHGASGQFVTHWVPDHIGGGVAVGDGPAWIVEIGGRFGNYNPVAAVQFYQMDPNPALGWGIKLITINHAGTAFTDALDVNIDRGLLNGSPILTGTASTGSSLGLQVFKVGPIDLTAIQPDTVIVPAVVGKRFVPIPGNGNSFNWTSTNESIGGALTTGPEVEFKAGATSIYTGFTLDATIFGEGLYGLGGDTIVEAAGIPPNTAITVDIPTAATGVGLAWSVEFYLVGFYL